MKNELRNILLRIRFQVQLGRQCRIARCRFEGMNKVGAKSELFKVDFGYGSYVAENSYLRSTRIGRFSSIGDHVRTGVGRHPVSENVSTHPVFFNERVSKRFGFKHQISFPEHHYHDNSSYFVSVGSDVWIGNNVTIADGVKVADGSIVGLGSFLTKDTEPYGVYVGTPAKLIKFRFPQSTIDSLLKIQWWSRDLDWLKSSARLFDDPQLFVQQAIGELDL